MRGEGRDGGNRGEAGAGCRGFEVPCFCVLNVGETWEVLFAASFFFFVKVRYFSDY